MDEINRFSNIVDMTFNNEQFMNGISETLATLKSFNKQVETPTDTKSFDRLEASINKINNRFSLLGNTVQSVYRGIASTITRAGSKLLEGIVISPPKEGLAEYNMQIGSVQTMMANTGRSVEDVNAALDDLNEYADKTIYNFSQMTRNAGLFTAAIGDQPDALEKSTKALKGIGNWAAYAGTDATTMARVTYQLSQAASAGAIRLQDWRSVETAGGMSGVNYRKAFIETAEEMGAIKKGQVTVDNFRDSLKKGWLSADIFFKTMEKFADNKAMTDAATKVKTLSQLIDTLKEALGSGWAQSWRTIIGDFEEAKEFWTRWNNILSGLIESSSKARNSLLSDWSDKGGRQLIIDSMFHSFNILANILGTVKKSFTDVFSPVTSKDLINISINIKSVVLSIEKFMKESAFLYDLHKIFKAIFSIFAIGVDITKQLGSAMVNLTKSIFGESNGILQAVLSFADYIIELRETNTITNATAKIINSLSKFLLALYRSIVAVISGIVSFGSKFSGFISSIKDAMKTIASGFGANKKTEKAIKNVGTAADTAATKIDGATSVIDQFTASIKSMFGGVLGKIDAFKQKFEKPISIISEIFNKLVEDIKFAFSTLSSLDFSILAGSGGIAGAILIFSTALKKTADKVTDTNSIFKGAFKGILDPLKVLMDDIGITKLNTSLSKLFDNLSKHLKTLTTSVQAKALVDIGKALLEMAAGLLILSAISPEGLAMGLSAIFLLSQTLRLIFEQIVHALDAWQPAKMTAIPAAAAALSSIASALLVLSVSAKILSTGDMKNTWQAIGMLEIMMVTVMGFIAVMQKIIGTASPAKLQVAVKGIKDISGAILTLSVAIKLLAVGDISSTWQAWMMAESMLLSIFAFIAVMQSIGSDGFSGLSKAVKGVTSISVAVGIMSLAIKAMSTGDISSTWQSWMMVESMLLSVFAFIAVMQATATGKFKNLNSAVGGVLAVGVAVTIMTNAIKNLATGDMQAVFGAWLMTETMLLSVFAFIGIIQNMKVQNFKGLKESAVTMVTLGISMKMLIEAMQAFGSSDLDPYNLLVGFGVIELVMVSMFAIIMELNKVESTRVNSKLNVVTGAFSSIALAITFMAGSLAKLAEKGGKRILASGLIMTALIAVIAGAFIAFDKLKINVGKMTVVSLALSMLMTSLIAMAGAIAIISSLDASGAWNALKVMGVAILGLTLGLGAIGTLMNATGLTFGLITLTLILGGLAAVAKVFGSAALLIAEGLLLIASSIGALAAVNPDIVAKAVTNLSAMLGALMGTIQMFIPQLIAGIVSGIIMVVGAMTRQIARALFMQIDMTLDLLLEYAPRILDKLVELLGIVVIKLLEFINTVVAPIVTFLLGCLVKVLNAIADWFDDDENASSLNDSIYRFAEKVGETFGSALKSALTGAYAGAVKGAGKIFGIEDAWDDYMTYMPDWAKPNDPAYKKASDMMEDAGEGLGADLVSGYQNGISNNSSDVNEAASNLGTGAINSIAKAQDSHSPSKEAYKLGDYVAIGYSEGMDDNADKAEDSANGIGGKVIGAISNKATELLGDQSDFQDQSLGMFKDYAGNMEAESKRLNEALAKNVKSSIRKETKIEGAQWQIDHGFGKEVTHYYETRIHQEDNGYTWKDEIEVDNHRYVQYEAAIAEANMKAREEASKTVEHVDSISEEEQKKAKERLKEMVNDVKDAYKEYTDAQDSAKEDLKNKGGIFDAVDWGFDPENPVTKETLKKNLEDQIAQVRRYNAAMASLNDKITNEELKKTIESMGVDKLEELEVLDTMSEGELNQYESLFADKMAEAVEGSFYKTEVALNEMGAKVNKTLGTNMNTDEIIGIIGDEFGGEVDENTIKKLAEVGGNLTQGILDGMTSDEAKSEITDSAEELLGPDGEVVEAEQIAADINSPSKVMRDEVGVYLLEGVLEGMNDENAAKRIQYVVTMLTAWIVNKFREQADNYAYIGEMLNYNIANGMLQSADVISNALNSTIDSAKDSMNLVVSAAGKSLASKSSSPVIKPVINDKSLNDYNDSMMTSLSGQRSFMLANQANASMSTEINKTIKVDNGNVIAAINRLDSDLLAVGERVNSLQVRLDSGALVGQIAPQMNSALGMQALRTGRYGG